MCAQGKYPLSSRVYKRCPSFHVCIADRATSLDKVLSDGSATDGFVFSKGLHCKKEKAGVVFIENRCPGSVVLVFKVLFHLILDNLAYLYATSAGKADVLAAVCGTKESLAAWPLHCGRVHGHPCKCHSRGRMSLVPFGLPGLAR